MTEVVLKKIEAWTYGYFPFTMGGRVYRPVSARVPCDSPVDLGKGFRGCLIHGPDGATKVVELSTGAVVGDTVEEVMRDIAECDDMSVMLKQVADAKAEVARGMDRVDPDTWWQRIRKK